MWRPCQVPLLLSPCYAPVKHVNIMQYRNMFTSMQCMAIVLANVGILIPKHANIAQYL